MSVCIKHFKKRTKLAFSKRKKHSARRGKTNSKFLNSKVLKLWLLLGKVHSHV